MLGSSRSRFAVPAARHPWAGVFHSRIRHTSALERRTSVSCSVSRQLLHLETAVLADMPTEQVIQLLQKHGVQTSSSSQDLQQQQQIQQQQQPSDPPPDSHQQQQHAWQQGSLPQRQKQQQRHASHQQQASNHISQRARRVAAAAARRSQLLAQLAAARVAARAKIVRLPLRLTIAGRAGSRRYLTVPVDVDGVGFVDFLLDSSSFYTRIVPAFRNKLGMGPADGVPVVLGQHNKPQTAAAAATAAAGFGDRRRSSSSVVSSRTGRLRMRQRVQLPQMWLGMSQLPKQQAYVAPLALLPNRRQPSSSSSTSSGSSASSPTSLAGSFQSVLSIAGSLGVQVLRGFELDVDVAGNLLAIHPAGHVDLGLCEVTGMTAVPCRYTKGGAIVLPVSLAGSPPFTGLLDLSAATSVINWEAAALLGMSCAERQVDSTHWQQEHQQQEVVKPSDTVIEQNSCTDGESAAGGSSAASMYGCFGNIVVVPDDMLPRPRLPRSSNRTELHKQIDDGQHHHQHQHHHTQGQNDSPETLKLPAQPPGQPADEHSGDATTTGSIQALPPVERDLTNKASHGNRDQSQGIYTPLRVQQHKVAGSQLKLVLGARLPASWEGSVSSNSASVAVPPPSRIGVAALKGLHALGIGGQPAMVIGADIWARSRAVLCLKASRIFVQT